MQNASASNDASVGLTTPLNGPRKSRSDDGMAETLSYPSVSFSHSICAQKAKGT